MKLFAACLPDCLPACLPERLRNPGLITGNKLKLENLCINNLCH